MPPYVHIKDKFGNDLHFGNFGEFWSTPYPGLDDGRQRMQHVRNLEMRPDDVIVVGFPKTGAHWYYEIVKMLTAGNNDYIVDNANEFMDGALPPSMMPAPDKPRVFFSHLKPKYLPLQTWEKKVKIIYHMRNPKDTWVSFYNFAKTFCMGLEAGAFGGTWDQFFELMMDMGFYYGDWFDHVLDWERQIAADSNGQILASHYEDVKRDSVKEIERIDKFLGLNRGSGLCQKIADACSFAKLKKNKDENIPEEWRFKFFTDGVPIFYRKGEVGDWKNWFTVAQNERFDEEYKKRMADSTLTFKYE
nr:hypothetical protein BaRGS_011904 [Batillaria attramentaria]